jgi:hypothetical protein
MGILGDRLPSDVRRSLGLHRGERILAWAPGEADETVVVATDRALHTRGWADDRHVPTRLAWHAILRAAWEEPVLSVVPLSAAGAAFHLELAAPGTLPAAVRDRVSASVLVQERVELSGGRGARAVARRDSDSGEVRWAVTFDAGLDPADPLLRAEADAALARLRSALGV